MNDNMFKTVPTGKCKHVYNCLIRKNDVIQFPSMYAFLTDDICAVFNCDKYE